MWTLWICAIRAFWPVGPYLYPSLLSPHDSFGTVGTSSDVLRRGRADEAHLIHHHRLFHRARTIPWSGRPLPPAFALQSETAPWNPKPRRHDSEIREHVSTFPVSLWPARRLPNGITTATIEAVTRKFASSKKPSVAWRFAQLQTPTSTAQLDAQLRAVEGQRRVAGKTLNVESEMPIVDHRLKSLATALSAIPDSTTAEGSVGSAGGFRADD
ncbi:hypothetical protein FB451DRAFT_1409558 [Mycena latifolia]|nr:hypothetical protein FB451DRAFT_1409558 [Mycena latifolia]